MVTVDILTLLLALMGMPLVFCIKNHLTYWFEIDFFPTILRKFPSILLVY